MDRRHDRRPRGAGVINKRSLAQLSAYLSIGFVTFVFLVHSNKNLVSKQKQMMTTATNLQANYIYDPDHGLNISHVCLSAQNVHKTRYKDSPCVNKTFIGWYNPWARHHSWKKLWKEKDEKRRERREMEKGKAMEEEAGENKAEMKKEEIVESPEKPEEPGKPLSGENDKKMKTENGKPVVRKKEKQIEMLYAILIALLLLSTMAACWEVVKERIKRHQAAELKAQEDRQCTLADFTINRHLRRESQQQNSSSLPRQGSLEQKSKVTQTFTHQSSLDRAFPITSSEALTPRTERRYSVPAALLGDGIASSKVTTASPSLIRVQRLSSVDVAPEDINVDTRKKPRHIIRRH